MTWRFTNPLVPLCPLAETMTPSTDVVPLRTITSRNPADTVRAVVEMAAPDTSSTRTM